MPPSTPMSWPVTNDEESEASHSAAQTVLDPARPRQRLVARQRLDEQRLRRRGRPVGPVGVDAGVLGEDAGRDRAGRDAVRRIAQPQLDRGRAGQLVHPGLRRRVADVRPARPVPADAGHVDDAARPARDHDPGRVLDAEEHPARVDGQRVEERRVVRLRERQRPRHAHPGVVDQHVQAAELVDRRGDQRLDVGLDADVGRGEPGPRPEFGGERLAHVLAPPPDDDTGALGEERRRRRGPDAAGGTGDHGDLVLEHTRLVIEHTRLPVPHTHLLPHPAGLAGHGRAARRDEPGQLVDPVGAGVDRAVHHSDEVLVGVRVVVVRRVGDLQRPPPVAAQRVRQRHPEAGDHVPDRVDHLVAVPAQRALRHAAKEGEVAGLIAAQPVEHLHQHRVADDGPQVLVVDLGRLLLDERVGEQRDAVLEAVR